MIGTNKQGVVMLIMVILVGSVLAVTVIQTAMSALIRLDSSQDSLQGQILDFQKESCIQEALIQLSRDETFTGDSYTLGAGTCSISVSGSGSTRTVTVTSSSVANTEETTITVNMDPFEVSNWDNI